jgi:hypothetical protein
MHAPRTASSHTIKFGAAVDKCFHCNGPGLTPGAEALAARSSTLQRIVSVFWALVIDIAGDPWGTSIRCPGLRGLWRRFSARILPRTKSSP